MFGLVCYVVFVRIFRVLVFFFFNDTATTEIYTLSLHDALPIYRRGRRAPGEPRHRHQRLPRDDRSEEHTSELQSLTNLVCSLLLEKKKKKTYNIIKVKKKKKKKRKKIRTKK